MATKREAIRRRGNRKPACIPRVAAGLLPDKIGTLINICLAPNGHRQTFHQSVGRQRTVRAKKNVRITIGCATQQSLFSTFTRGVGSEFNVTQELVSPHSTHETVTGEDVFLQLKVTVLRCSSQRNRLKCMTMHRGGKI